MSESLNGKTILITGAVRWVGNSFVLACARIANILDWHAMIPGGDHFPYRISKAAMAAITKSLAVALAPKIIVNGLALGAILPPSDGKDKADMLVMRKTKDP